MDYDDFVTKTEIREHPERFLTDRQLAICDATAKELAKRVAETLAKVSTK